MVFGFGIGDAGILNRGRLVAGFCERVRPCRLVNAARRVALLLARLSEVCDKLFPSCGARHTPPRRRTMEDHPSMPNTLPPLFLAPVELDAEDAEMHVALEDWRSPPTE